MFRSSRPIRKAAIELRRKPTKAERVLWEKLRRNSLGFKFYRQRPVGYYIVDFYCPAARLIVEVDGEIHESANQALHDRERDEFLRSSEYFVLRLTNDEVLNRPDVCVDRIPAVCDSL